MEGVRINKYLSGMGICSRREADRLLEEGRIRVNGVQETARRKKLTIGDVVALETDDGRMEYQVSQ